MVSATLALVLLISCNKHMRLRSVWSYHEDSEDICNHSISKLIYDTVETDFLYEAAMSSYIWAGGYVEENGLIKYGIPSKELYMSGLYYFTGHTYHSKDYSKCIIQNNPSLGFRYNYMSVSQIFDSIEYCAFDTTINIEQINSSCDDLYYKCHLKMEVAYIGEVKRKLPLFADCDSVKRYISAHQGKRWQVAEVPTYIITKVFNYKLYYKSRK